MYVNGEENVCVLKVFNVNTEISATTSSTAAHSLVPSDTALLLQDAAAAATVNVTATATANNNNNNNSSSSSNISNISHTRGQELFLVAFLLTVLANGNTTDRKRNVRRRKNKLIYIY